MKLKDKAKLRGRKSKRLSELLTVRTSKNETIQIIPKVNSSNQIKHVDIAKFRYGRNETSLRINRRSLPLFLKSIGHLSDHLEDEQLDASIPDLTKQRIR